MPVAKRACSTCGEEASLVLVVAGVASCLACLDARCDRERCDACGDLRPIATGPREVVPAWRCRPCTRVAEGLEPFDGFGS